MDSRFMVKEILCVLRRSISDPWGLAEQYLADLLKDASPSAFSFISANQSS